MSHVRVISGGEMRRDHRKGAHSVGPSGEAIVCGWDDCQARGLLLNRIVLHYGVRPGDYDVTHLFCTDRHKRYWLNSHVHYGRLPTGERGRLL